MIIFGPLSIHPSTVARSFSQNAHAIELRSVFLSGKCLLAHRHPYGLHGQEVGPGVVDAKRYASPMKLRLSTCAALSTFAYERRDFQIRSKIEIKSSRSFNGIHNVAWGKSDTQPIA